MANISSAATGDWNATSSWSGGAVPVAGDLVTILSGHNITLTQDQPTGAVVINSGGTLTGGGFKLTLNDNAGTTFIFSNVGTISGNLDIDITGGSADRPINEAGTGSIRNLLINNAQTYNLHYHLSLSGNLTLTTGTLTTVNSGGTNNSLTVTGEVNIASGATLTCNSSVCSFGSLHSQGTANLADASGSTLITNEDGDGLSIIAGTFSNCVPSKIKHNNGTVTFNNHSDPAAHAAIVIGVSTSTDGLYNVIIDGANTIVDTYQPSGGSQHCTIFNDFTVTNGNFRVNSASNPFTVLGNVTVNGGNMFNTSAAPTAAHSFGSLRVVSGATFKATSGTTTLSKEADTGGTDFMFHNDGTFTHNNGKFLFDDAGLSSSSNVRCSSSFYDVELTMGSFNLTSHHNMNVANDFTVTTGLYSDGSNGFTITGDVSVANGATLNLSNSSTQTKTLGSLTIASGATVRGCRGTTVITNETSSHAWKNEGGTFTHNNGKVKFDLDNSAGSSNVKENEFYDVEVDMFASTYSLSFFDTSGNAVTIHNNLDLTKGEINFSTSSDTITIHGLTKIAADGTFSDNAAHDTNKIIHNGLVTNLGTYKINDGTTVKMNGGIRNLGTITVA